MKAMTMVVLLALLGVSAPRPAHAKGDFTTPLIISGAVAGAGALIAIIAILGSGNDQPQLLAPAPPSTQPPPSRVRFGPRCSADAGNLPLLCW